MKTFKSTTVYIAMGHSTQVFRSPGDIPDRLRKRLVESTRGMNSATILIADRGGREEIRKILSGEPSPLKSRLRSEYLKRAIGGTNEEAKGAKAPAGAAWRGWAELMLPGAVGVGLWVLFTWK